MTGALPCPAPVLADGPSAWTAALLQASDLPARWRDERQQTQHSLLLSHFGCGEAFMAVLQAWQAWQFAHCDAQRPQRLLVYAHCRHAVSPECLPAALAAIWPPATANIHVLDFDDACVRLLLAVGSADPLRQMRQFQADTLWVDGAALPWPRALARLAAPGARLLLWNASPAQAEELRAHGFAAEGSFALSAVDAVWARSSTSSNTSADADASAGGTTDSSAGQRTSKQQAVNKHDTQATSAIAVSASGDAGAAATMMQRWRFAPRGAPTRALRPRHATRAPQHALVIGAGIAGACAAAALARRGWSCQVLDARLQPAGGASGNPAALVHGTVHAVDGTHARFTRAAALQARHLYAPLLAQGVPGVLNGLLRSRIEAAPPVAAAAAAAAAAEPAASATAATPSTATAAQAPSSAARARHDTAPMPWPPHRPVPAAPAAVAAGSDDAAGCPGYAELCSAQWLQAGSGLRADSAWFFPGGGWVDAAATVRALLTTPGVQFTGGAATARLQRESDAQGGHWCAFDTQGRLIGRAPVVVLALAAAGDIEAPGLATLLQSAGGQAAPVERTRGQVSWFDHDGPALSWPLAGGGYAISGPAAEQVESQGQGQGQSQRRHRLLCGATTQPGDDDARVRSADHAQNLARLLALTGIAPGPAAGPDAAASTSAPAATSTATPALDPAALATAPLQGRVGWRERTPDRLPLVGAVPALAGLDTMRHPRLALLPRLPGLFILGGMAGRGFTWGPLAGEVLASLIDGSAVPLEASLLDAIDPARFWLRQQRQRERGD